MGDRIKEAREELKRVVSEPTPQSADGMMDWSSRINDAQVELGKALAERPK